MSEVKRYKKRLTRSQIELAQPRTEFVLAADYDALEAEHDQARRTAEYWKAEHLAGNQALDAALKQVDGLRELAEQANVNCRNTAYYLKKYRPDLSDICSGWCDAICTALSAKP